MSRERLSPEQRRQVCEDLLLINQAGRVSRLRSLRKRLLSQHPAVDVWLLIAADRLAKQASQLIGGNRADWQDAAEWALGVPTTVDLSIEAVCTVADDVRLQESQQAAERVHLSIGTNKRGSK